MTVARPQTQDNSHAAPAGQLLISDSQLSKLSEFVATQMGLHFPKERWQDLERGIASVAREFGFNDAESCIQWLISSPLTRNQIEVLASHLTVGETYFFREKKIFEILEEHIFSELIHSRAGTEKRLRIWSAGCATGEEPYSIAILLSKMIPDIRDWNITILATDVNPHFLKKASIGAYNEWSFRDTPSWVKERYFKKTKENRFEILPHIKKMVTFSYHNLAEDAYPSLTNNTNAMDVIFCRNVLMYFGQDSQKKVIQNLYRCLVDGGYLIVSPSETSHVLFSQFAVVNFHDAIFYKKQGAGIQAQWPGIRGYEEIINQQLPAVPELETPEPEIEYKAEKPISEIFPSAAEPKQPIQDIYAEAKALYEQGRYEEAEEKIGGEGGFDAKAMELLSRVYANQGKLSEAVELCEKAIATDKLNPGSHYLLATILQEQGRVEEATASLKRALYLDQNFVLAHFALGNLTKQQGKFKESVKHFENALFLLKKYRQEDVLIESEGMTAGRLSEIINVCLKR